jgi:uncharacterized protein (UPF0332 family)
VSPEAGQHLDKARDCLARGRIILAAGIGEDAGRNAYLAAFHAAQALILARLGRVAKTHRGVHRLFSSLVMDDPELNDLAVFLSQTYNLKSVADYELGAGADVPLERASAALDTAARFIERIASVMPPGDSGGR